MQMGGCPSGSSSTCTNARTQRLHGRQHTITTRRPPGRRAEAGTPCNSPGRPCSVLLLIRALPDKSPCTCSKGKSYFKHFMNDSQCVTRKAPRPADHTRTHYCQEDCWGRKADEQPAHRCHYGAPGSPSSRRQSCMHTRPCARETHTAGQSLHASRGRRRVCRTAGVPLQYHASAVIICQVDHGKRASQPNGSGTEAAGPSDSWPREGCRDAPRRQQVLQGRPDTQVAN